MDDLISRQAAIDGLGEEPEVWSGEDEYAQGLNNQWHYDRNALKAVPSAQPEITDEQAIEHLRSTGWMQNHDREMYDMGLKEQLADDSGSYDSLLPSAQPEIIRCKECLMHGVCRFEQGLGLDGYCSQAERRTENEWLTTKN